MATVLVLGSGAREHALAWKVAQSTHVESVLVAPGNPGCETLDKVKTQALNINDNSAVTIYCLENNVNLVVVGPEAPLANGLSDSLHQAGIKCFGPTRDAAQLESSKEFAKRFMDRHGISTAPWRSFSNSELAKKFVNSASEPHLVVKASGLAAGKGVIVAKSRNEACDAVDALMNEKVCGSAGDVIVVEELLGGEEVSILAFTDGHTVALMPPARDYKRLGDGDTGPNTGGMGAYCPCQLVDKALMADIKQNIIEKAIKGMEKDGVPFVGVLYAGLMLTKNGPQVLEFNCRFGDPEAEVILPLLNTDLYLIMLACVSGTLDTCLVEWKTSISAVGIVMASRGYPSSAEKGQEITGWQAVESAGMLLFQAATKKVGNGLVTNGGRVLVVVACGSQQSEALANVLEGVSKIKFSGAQYRTDIASNVFSGSTPPVPSLTYSASGVSIDDGEKLVDLIRPLAAMSHIPGVMGSVGSFGGLFDLASYNFKDPILVSGTDGVGTKLTVASALRHHSKIGIDLVAMCVNDVLVHGAKPLFFLDYFACGKLNVQLARDVVAGVVEGCQQAGCALLGGETAEMPGMYSNEDYDVAGFAVGIVERNCLLPQATIQPNDVIIGIGSSGVHSNGFSLIRKIVQRTGLQYTDSAPFNPEQTLGQALLTATRIFTKSVLPIMSCGIVKGAAHITGGGLLQNVPRVLPKNLGAKLDAQHWSVPAIFGWLAQAGNVTETEMLKTFNCGIGMALVVDPRQVDEVLKLLSRAGEKAWRIGVVTDASPGNVIVENFPRALADSYSASWQVHSSLSHRKRVAVLISGTGSNLQALLNSFNDSNNSEVSVSMTLVISNKPNVQGLERAKAARVPTQVIDHRNFTSRLDFDMAVDAALQKAEIDIVCLAGFMRILTGEFVRRWNGRLLNIHPSLLPSFKGLHPHQQALDAGVCVSGCTVHFVIEELDSGGIIAQETVPVVPGDTAETLQERVKSAEHRTYPRALALVANGRVKLGNNNTVLRNVKT